ncbi:MAG: DUF2169 domain-containing protein [Oxalobacteraceae bacterium]|nr:MAG: DUF2169 domain-containing protein [Oxalobacteraceae bacterium]
MAWQESKRIAGDAWLRAPGPNGERSRELLLDKAIHVCGGREFVRQRNEWVLRQTSTESRVPLRYELAYGGSCVVVNPVYVDDPASVQLLMNEVCYLNPIGRGWVHEDYLRTLSSIGLPHPLVVPAPQIELESSGMSRPDVTPQSGGLQPPEMALLSQQYSHRPAGFGPIGRAWTPRIQRAGTYDDRWTEDRWPALPEDFDMAYWNAAPEDQQIRFPRPDLYVELGNLVDPALCPSGYAVVVLPGHRASVLFHLASGLMLGGPCVIDTLHVDTDAMEIAITWRASVLVEMNVVTAELRFETDLRCPLFQKKTRPPQAMPQESPHG